MRTLLLALIAAAGCRSPEVVVDPPGGSMAGYEEVRVDLSDARIDPDEVRRIELGGIEAYDLEVDGDAVVFWTQGAPKPGPADLVLVADGDRIAFPDAYHYDQPLDPVFDRVFAVGASLTQGVQGGVPTRHAQLHSPGAFLARQAGAYYALPLLNEDLFPTIDADDIGPAPDCTVPNVVNFVASAAVEVLAQINDVENDRLDFALARATPDLEPRNVAVGGSNIRTLVDGPGDDFATGFLAKLVYDVHADVADDVDTSQLDLVEAGDPSLILVTDTYGNDLIISVVEGNGIDPSKLTDEEQFRVKLREFVDRTAATGAEVFVANMARATLLPATEEKLRAAVAAAELDAINRGEDPVAAGEAEEALQLERIQQVVDRGLLFNQILDEYAADHPNVHVVDFYGRVEQIDAEGLQIGDQLVNVDKFGGLLSTDGVHFSDTGYAMFANLFLETIEAELGVSVPLVDLGPVHDADPYNPDNLRRQGLDPDACVP